MEKIMSKSSMEVRELTDELSGDELDTVTGGSALSKAIDGVGKAIEHAASAPEGPPEVWVGCAWVPQWW